jgi:hypothetical protein
MSATGTRRAKREYCLQRAAAYDRFARKYPSKANYYRKWADRYMKWADEWRSHAGAINDCLRICSCEHGRTDPGRSTGQANSGQSNAPIKKTSPATAAAAHAARHGGLMSSDAIAAEKAFRRLTTAPAMNSRRLILSPRRRAAGTIPGSQGRSPSQP